MASFPDALWKRMLGSGQWTIVCHTAEAAEQQCLELDRRSDEWGTRVVLWKSTHAVDVVGATYDYHVGTVHAFKGLEANQVIIADVTDFDLRERTGRDSLYVALTRPRSVLHVVGPELGALDARLAKVVTEHAEVVRG